MEGLPSHPPPVFCSPLSLSRGGGVGVASLGHQPPPISRALPTGLGQGCWESIRCCPGDSTAGRQATHPPREAAWYSAWLQRPLLVIGPCHQRCCKEGGGKDEGRGGREQQPGAGAGAPRAEPSHPPTPGTATATESTRVFGSWAGRADCQLRQDDDRWVRRGRLLVPGQAPGEGRPASSCFAQPNSACSAHRSPGGVLGSRGGQQQRCAKVCWADTREGRLPALGRGCPEEYRPVGKASFPSLLSPAHG